MTIKQFKHVDLTGTLEELHGDADALRQLATEFVKRYSEHMLRLHRAYEELDLNLMALWLHRLRGGLGLFNAQRALAMAITLELEARSGSFDISSKTFHDFMYEFAGVGHDLSCYLEQLTVTPVELDGTVDHAA